MSARVRGLKVVPKQEPVLDLEEINRKLRVLAMALHGLAVDCGGFGSSLQASEEAIRSGAEILTSELEGLQAELQKAVMA